MVESGNNEEMQYTKSCTSVVLKDKIYLYKFMKFLQQKDTLNNKKNIISSYFSLTNIRLLAKLSHKNSFISLTV